MQRSHPSTFGPSAPRPSGAAQEAEPKLPNLLKLLTWAQRQLDERAAYPRIDNLVSGELLDPPPPGADD